MPVSVIGPRVNYAPVNDLVEVLLIFYLIILTLMQYVEIWLEAESFQSYSTYSDVL